MWSDVTSPTVKVELIVSTQQDKMKDTMLHRTYIALGRMVCFSMSFAMQLVVKSVEVKSENVDKLKVNSVELL